MTFKFASVEHFIATGFNKIKSDADAVAKYLGAHLAGIDKAADTAAAIVGVVDPALAAAALAIDRSGQAALAAITQAIEKAGSAADANGVNVPLDAAAVAAYKEAIATVKAVSPNLTNPPAAAIAK